MWEIPTLRRVWERTNVKGEVDRLAFSPDGRRVATRTGTGTLTVMDVDTGRDRLAIRVLSAGGIFGIAFSPDHRLIATGGYDGTLTLYDADNGKEVRTFKGHLNPILDLSFSPDCRRLVSAGWNPYRARSQILGPRDGQGTHQSPWGMCFERVEFSPRW